MRFVRENGLSLFFGVLFLAALAGSRWRVTLHTNQERVRRGAAHDETGASG